MMLILNDEQRLLAGVVSLGEPCKYCSKAFAEYPLILCDDVDQTVDGWKPCYPTSPSPRRASKNSCHCLRLLSTKIRCTTKGSSAIKVLTSPSSSASTKTRDPVPSVKGPPMITVPLAKSTSREADTGRETQARINRTEPEWDCCCATFPGSLPFPSFCSYQPQTPSPGRCRFVTIRCEYPTPGQSVALPPGRAQRARVPAQGFPAGDADVLHAPRHAYPGAATLHDGFLTRKTPGPSRLHRSHDPAMMARVYRPPAWSRWRHGPTE
jgi:hypothetical protein